MRLTNHLTLLIYCLGFLCILPKTSSAQTPSVLSEGDWFRMPIAEDGVYAITFSYLSSMGVDPSSVNPSQLKVYGYGGGMLPQPLDSFRYDDLPEVAMRAIGLADNRFDESDMLLFYAKGPHNTTFQPSGNYFTHQLNLYSDHSYYFLNITGPDGLRINSEIPINIVDATPIDWFPAVVWIEEETVNRDESGREWYGSPLESGSRKDFTVNTPNFASHGQNIVLRFGGMMNTYSPATIQLFLNNTNLGDFTTDVTFPGDYPIKGVEKEQRYTLAASQVTLTNQTSIGLRFQAASSVVSSAYPNYFTLTYPRLLNAQGGEKPWLIFHTHHRANIASRIQLSGTSNTEIWQVDDPINPIRININATGSTLSWDSQGGHDFIAFTPGNVPTPGTPERIANQNLGEWNSPNLVIVTHPTFLPAANRLANFRRNWDGLRVRVVTTDQVYNQFASGQPDVSAIRNMAKYLHDNYSSFRYLLVFGKGSYDYKHLLSDRSDYNFVPVYQSRESLDPLKTYSSDDYLGFLEDHEGAWEETHAGNHTLDIGVGRIPATSLQEANIMVDKLIHYSQANSTIGDWRQRMLFLADDEDSNTHLRDAERITSYLDTAEAQLMVKKLYLDAYPQYSLGSSEDSPEARLALNELLFRGTLMVNYTGHGSERAWAEEGLFREELIGKWENYDRLPLFITATCEFGRHDSPIIRSAAEKILFSDIGGAIGLLTTSRPVYANSNYLVNRTFYEQAFHRLQDGSLPRLGDILLRTKNRSINGVNNRNFILLGDPSMRLAYPEYEIVVTEVNGRAIDSTNNTLQALERVTIKGQVVDQVGNPVNNYNGTLTASLFDNQTQSRTLGTPPANTAINYSSRQNLLFRGQTSVASGSFTLHLVVPKNIDYSKEGGRLHMYAHDPSQYQDAQGVTDGLKITGSNYTSIDFDPPTINLWLNDSTFQSGGITESNPVLVAKLSDASGLNLSQTNLGHAMRAVVDDGPEQFVSDFFVAAPDDFGSGWLRFPLFDLEPGVHEITLHAHDVYNNGASKSLSFIVSANGLMALQDVLNYPNPFANSTTFKFAHNRAGEPLSVQVQIFSSQGSLVRSLEWQVNNSTNVVDELTWDGTDEKGRPLHSGVYLYKIFVKSNIDQVYTQATQRMVVIK